MNGIDCATKLTSANCQALRSAGIDAVGRYLGRNMDKGLTLDELKNIQASNLKLFLIWETSPTKPSYFYYDKGVSDAQQALAEAIYLGAPQGVAIYFTVDYQAQPGDMASIKEYFHGIHTVMTGKYLVGAYGSYAVLGALKGADYPPDRYYQTYAWSGGKQTANHIYQWSNDVHVVGIAVDQDYVNDNAGLWVPGIPRETEEKKVFANLVIYQDGADKRAAEYLADHLKAPIVCVDNATPELLACATNKYKVGGAAYPGAQLISGNDRFGTMKAVLAAMGK